MIRALCLAASMLVACSPCPAGTRLVETPISGTETEKTCQSEGGILHGPYWRYRGGDLVLEGSYEFGDRQGTWVSYADDGDVTALQQYQGDLKTGTWRAWNDAGQLLSEVSWYQGRRHGPEVHWYPTGQLKQKGGNVEGRREGVWTTWYPEGQRRTERNFDLGTRDGAWIEWAEDGRVLVRGTYVDGERHGRWEEWYPDGQPRIRITYDHGLPGDEAKYWDEEGNPRPPVTTGEADRARLADARLGPLDRPPDPRLAWAVDPPGDARLGAPAEVRDVVVVGAGAAVYGLQVNDPSEAWQIELPEPVAEQPPAVDNDHAWVWTTSGQLLVVRPTRHPVRWSLHRLDADLAVEPQVSDPHVLFVGRDNRLRLYDRELEDVRWSHALEGEALLVGLLPDRAWVLTTAGHLVTYSRADGSQLASTAFTEGVRPRWTSTPRRGFLVYWWNGDVLEAIRPGDGQVAWTWPAPDRLNPDEARLARVSNRFGDLGIYQGHRAWYLDTAGSGTLEAATETFTQAPPAAWSSCISWGKVCVRAAPDGRIRYPGGRPWLGTGLAAPPALGQDRLWVSTTAGWLGRLDFEPMLEVDVTRLLPGEEDEERFALSAGLDDAVRKVRWTPVVDEPWTRVALDLGEARPREPLRVRLAAPAGRSGDLGPPAWADGWTVTDRVAHEEARYRYRLYRRLGAIDLPDLGAERLEGVLSCEDREVVETSGTIVLLGSTAPGAEPAFRRQLTGTFRLGSASFAKACAIILSYEDPDTGSFRKYGAYGAPDRPLATTQEARLALYGTQRSREVGTPVAPRPPEDLEGVERLRMVLSSGFGPSREVVVDAPRGITVDDGGWTVEGADGPVAIALPELSLDGDVHDEPGRTYPVTTWSAEHPPIAHEGPGVVVVYDRRPREEGTDQVAVADEE